MSQSLAIGSHSITVSYLGDGNFNTSTSPAAALAIAQAGTTTTLAATPTSAGYGQPVTLTATVKVVAPGSGLPTQTVTFYDGTTVVGAATLNASGTATLTTTALPVGAQSITAKYNGDVDFTSSTSTASTVTITKVAASAVVTSAVNPSVYGQPVQFSVTVAPAAGGAGVPSGTVTLRDSGALLGTASLSGGTATFSLSTLTVATHSIIAVYSGDANFTTVTSAAVSQAVSAASTTIALVSNVNPSVFGQSVSYTATVSAVAPSNAVPTGGAVNFYAGGTLIGSSTLTAGSATLTKALAVGSQAITASYVGTTSYLPASTATSLTQIVNQDVSSATLTSSLNPSVFGQSVTLQATLTAAAPGAGTPTGTVTFTDGSTTLGTATLSGGVARLAVKSLSVGTHLLAASYGGDGNFTTSVSANWSQTVGQSGSTTSVTVSTLTPVFGQSVTVTATVAAASPGSGVATGSVTFFDNGTQLAVVSLTNGVARWTSAAAGWPGRAWTRLSKTTFWNGSSWGRLTTRSPTRCRCCPRDSTRCSRSSGSRCGSSSKRLESCSGGSSRSRCGASHETLAIHPALVQEP